MSVDAKQIEWVWEFFLKNCNDGRMIQDLLNALPFPNENLDLKRMLFHRALSMQISAGEVDELTLDIFRGIRELTKVEGARRERHPTGFSRQETPKRRKLSEDDSNDDEVAVSVEATISATPVEKDGRATSTSNLDQHRESSEDVRKVETVGIKDSMKGGGLPRGMGWSGPSEEQMKGCNLNYKVINAVNAETPHGAGHFPKGGEHIIGPSQWVLELTVMLELAVKHLRGDIPDRKSFEHAVTKLCGESSWDDTDGCGPDSLDVATIREQIKSELWMVRKNPELLDGVIDKFTKARVDDMLKTYMEKAWTSTSQTFLERVSADVINGKYKPVNFNGQWGKKAGSPLTDGEVGHQNNGKVNTSEKQWIRASRGQYSRSLEKLQRNFAVGDVDDDNEGGSIAKLPAIERNREDEEARAEQQAGRGSNRLDQKEDTCHLQKMTLEGGLDINGKSQNFDVMVKGVVRVLQFDEHSDQEIEVGMQHSQEKQNNVRVDIETIATEDVVHQTDRAGALPCGGVDVDGSVCSPVNCVPDIVELPQEVCNVMNLSREKKTSIADDEKSTKEATSPTNANWLGLELGCPHEAINKENVVPPLSPKHMDSNPTVCFNAPPWVKASPAVLVVEGMASGLPRKRKSGLVQEDLVTEFRKEETRSAEAAAQKDGSNHNPRSTTTQQNLRRKQRVLDAVVEDPLPRIPTTRSKGSLFKRSAIVHNIEVDCKWDKDEIEESPSSSPLASRYVQLHPTAGKVISPLTSLKTSGDVNSKQARRKTLRWSEKEVEIFKKEVGKYGKGRWKMIWGKNLGNFRGRSEVDLKDKWRNLKRFEGITD